MNRKAQYEGADVFAICCAANQRTSMESIAKWKAEIQEKEPTKPIALLQTKRDLVEIIDFRANLRGRPRNLELFWPIFLTLVTW